MVLELGLGKLMKVREMLNIYGLHGVSSMTRKIFVLGYGVCCLFIAVLSKAIFGKYVINSK